VKALLGAALACSLAVGSATAASARSAHECRANPSATPRRELPEPLRTLSPRQKLVGEGDLWTVRPGRLFYTDGADGWTRLKQPWFRLDDGQLTIEGRRVDGATGSFRADIPPMEAYPRNMNVAGFIPSGLEFSTGGCWKITARFRDSKVVLHLDVTRQGRGR
jgi:hypothetical protein